MALDPITKQYARFKRGDRVRVRTGYRSDAPRVKGTVIFTESATRYHASLEMYTVELDEPSYLNMEDSTRRLSPYIWITDSSMCEALPLLDDLSEV